MNFLKSDVESMISYSNNNRSFLGETENVYASNQEQKDNYEIDNSIRNNKVKVVSHNPPPQSKVVNETKTKVIAESKEKKKPSTVTSNLNSTASKKNLVPSKKK